jgi:hypothetical protein
VGATSGVAVTLALGCASIAGPAASPAIQPEPVSEAANASVASNINSSFLHLFIGPRASWTLPHE